MKLNSKLFTISFSGILSILVIGTFFVFFHFKNLEQEIEKQKASEIKNEFERILDAKKDVWLTNALQIAQNFEIRQALKAGDREKAYRVISSLGNVFKENTNFKNVAVHIITKDKKSFLKSWNFESYGEKLEYSDGFSYVIDTGRSFCAMEISPLGLRLKGLFPVFDDNGKITGIINFEGGLNSIKRLLEKKDIYFLYFMDEKDLETAKSFSSFPKTKNLILSQNDYNKEFFSKIQNLDKNEFLPGSFYCDSDYLVYFGEFEGFSNKKTGRYMLGINSQKIKNIVASEKKFIIWIFSSFFILFSILVVFLIFFINKTIISPMKHHIIELNDNANEVLSSSNEVADSSNHLAEGASEQAASIEQTSSSLEEMSSMTKRNSENSNEANKIVEDTKAVFERAAKSMIRMEKNMKDISEAGSKTSEIVKSIDEIAFQTNLLALNAAVEAARAGEAGAGFSVVANEVRNLASRASEAAKNTSVLIEESGSKIQSGTILVKETRMDFDSVLESSLNIAKLVNEIAGASKEQADGIEQINIAVSQMDKVTQQNASAAEESAAASGEMKSRASSLKELAARIEAMIK
ncbi:MAG: hypothetical protein H6680_08180 [Desulfobacteraceae bacterium]|nr:hypothetical protein [Desulfobacteraceae bacterium]